MGREHQAASNSHAMPGTLTGGTRRHRAHPLRALSQVQRGSGGETAGVAGHQPSAAGWTVRAAHGLVQVGNVTVALALPILFVAALVVLRTGGVSAGSARVTGPVVEVPSDASARTRLTAAASAMETAFGKGGGGITFEIVQTQTMQAKPDGPRIEIPDPADRTRILGYTDTMLIGTLIERGLATPAGFWSELIHGPVPGAEAAFELAKAEPARQALVRDGVAYRNDGDGWHKTTALPGIGLDPATVAKLPALLRDAADAADTALKAETDPAFTIPGLQGPAQPATRAIDATSKVANVPGVLAPDLAAATRLTRPTDFALDDAGRLVSLTIFARNANMELYDLVVKTVITFRYPDTSPPLPEPLPAYVAPASASDGE